MDDIKTTIGETRNVSRYFELRKPHCKAILGDMSLNGSILSSDDIYIKADRLDPKRCPICGNKYKGFLRKTCPACGWQK